MHIALVAYLVVHHLKNPSRNPFEIHNPPCAPSEINSGCVTRRNNNMIFLKRDQLSEFEYAENRRRSVGIEISLIEILQLASINDKRK